MSKGGRSLVLIRGAAWHGPLCQVSQTSLPHYVIITQCSMGYNRSIWSFRWSVIADICLETRKSREHFCAEVRSWMWICGLRRSVGVTTSQRVGVDEEVSPDNPLELSIKNMGKKMFLHRLKVTTKRTNGKMTKCAPFPLFSPLERITPITRRTFFPRSFYVEHWLLPISIWGSGENSFSDCTYNY